jgi:hypothetical protein
MMLYDFFVYRKRWRYDFKIWKNMLRPLLYNDISLWQELLYAYVTKLIGLLGKDVIEFYIF